ncbi:MAG TPA: carotenoid oxygenase family protein, partial [Treponemataceae bacterium]|nr:carotenoid oxygenase family protein [Treponemataceae bacterium]
VESSLPYEITNDLETVGCYDFGGKLDDSMTAHPKICPTTGELHFFGYGNLFQPHVTYHRVDANGELTVSQAYTEAEGPIRMFMYRQMSRDTSAIATFMTIAKLDKPRTLADVPTRVLVPAYILHELTVAFKIGILLYIPFIVIDMVVASILMSMGMIMLPPVQISMPFKLILFVLVDGWGLLTQQLFNSFM